MEKNNANKVNQLFERSGIDPDDYEKIERVNVWEMGIKNSDGEFEAHQLTGVQLSPKQDEVDIESLLVRKAAPTLIRPSRRKKTSRNDSLTLVAGDAQIPFHDPQKVDEFQQAVYDEQPDNVVYVGDMIDLQQISKYGTRPEWVGTTQESIDSYHNLLAQTRANAPNSNIYVVHGNHEQRMDDYVRKNAMEVLGLRRASMQDELAVLTLQYLVRYDDLEVESIDGYPNGTLWLEDNLKFIHGTETKRGGSNAAAYLSKERETTIYGHTHRLELAYRTFAKKFGSVTIAAASPGCLAKIDGTVPGYNHVINSQGEVIQKAQDWQNGMLRIEHNENHHKITPIRFESSY